MDILCEIQKKYNNLSDKEKLIADYIMKYGENFKNIGITELAKEIGTSGSTITRFAKKIGCDSFVEMKIMLNSNKSEDIVQEESEIFDYTYKYYSEVIKRSKSLINKELILKVVDEIKKANNIHIYGVGSSGLTGKEMMQRLLRMGFNVHCISDSHMMIINSSIVKKDDLVIGISISGKTHEVIQSLRKAKENGAKIISITSFEESEMATYSDMILTVYNPKFIDKNKFVNSQFSTMYLLDLISMVLLKDQELNEKMNITIEAIKNS